MKPSEFKRMNIHGIMDRISKTPGAELGSAEEILNYFFAVMRGEVKRKRRVRDPAPDEDAISAALIPWIEETPTIAESTAAAKVLLEYRIGKPTQPVAVDVSLTAKVERNLSALTDAELERLEELTSKVQIVEGVAVPKPITVDAHAAEPEDAELIK